MAFPAGGLFSLTVYEPTVFIVRCVMTYPTAAFFEAFCVDIMGKANLRPSQVAEDIFMGQNVFRFLGHRDLPPDSAHTNHTNYEG